MNFLIDHALAIVFALIFVLGVVLGAAVIRDWPDDGPACIECGCTNRRACPGRCWWISTDPFVCSSCGTVDLLGNVWLNRNDLIVGKAS